MLWPLWVWCQLGYGVFDLVMNIQFDYFNKIKLGNTINRKVLSYTNSRRKTGTKKIDNDFGK